MHRSPHSTPAPVLGGHSYAPRRIAGARTLILLGALAIGALAVGAGRPALAQGAPRAADTLRLDLAAVRARAVTGNPDLVAARLDTAIARGELRQARALPFNPSFGIVAAGGGKGAEPEVSQEVEIFGQRGVRLGAGRAGLARAEAAVTDARRRVLGDVDRAFYRLAAATKRAELADEVLALNRRLSDVASRQLQAGEISRLDYNLALVELGRSRARALGAMREREQVTVELRRLAGVPGRPVILPVVDSASEAAVVGLTLDTDSLTLLALSRRPDLRERDEAAGQARARASLAQREALPNLIGRVVSERESGAARTFRPGIGVTLPIFNLNRGTVAAQRATARQAELERAALATRARAEVAAAVAAYTAADDEVRVLEATVLEPARQNRALLEIAYREGKVGLPVLLLIRNQVVDAEFDYWAAWLAAREARAGLAEATAENLSTNVEGDVR